jgi:hypothetical protein
MVFGGFSLILAVSFWGHQAQAVPYPQGDREHSQDFQHTLAIMAGASQTLENNGSPPSSSTSPSLDVPAMPSTIVTSSSSTALSGTSILPSSTTGPTVTYFESRWFVPEHFKAGGSEDIFYEILNNPTLSDGTPIDPVLFVCQTSVQMVNGTLTNAMDSSNTWSVTQIPSMPNFNPHLLRAS